MDYNYWQVNKAFWQTIRRLRFKKYFAGSTKDVNGGLFNHENKPQEEAKNILRRSRDFESSHSHTIGNTKDAF